ncbi:MAG: adaptor protein MecA [Lachnospiraceae bacterium]|nr:adaptor protein MecA [Lachnospiraceae bacterium]
MKIEKISDNQIKFTLSNSELIERNIKLDDLLVPSEKVQTLFREIMEQAMEECGFTADDSSPFMVEALPVALDGIMIIVTKLPENETSEGKYTLGLQTRDTHKFKRKGISYSASGLKEEGDILILSFASLNDVTNFSARLSGAYHGTNSLYKFKERYFLIMENNVFSDNIKIEDLELVAGDYGQKHISTVLSKNYIAEHGESIIKDYAVRLLSDSFV